MHIDATKFEIGKNRIEALSDGIFAIVMTLLILEFHVPNLPLNAPNVEVAPALLALAEVRKLHSNLCKPGILLGRSPYHVPRYPTR